MKKKDYRYILSRLSGLFLAIILAFSGAALSLAVSPAPVRAEAATVKINRKKKTIYVGQSFKLKIKNTKQNCKWKSSKPDVAMIAAAAGQTATIGGLKAGKAVITATCGKKTFKCKVTVKARKDDNPGGTGGGEEGDPPKRNTISTLEEELDSDYYGLLYPKKKTDYQPRTYYNISTDDDLLKVMIDGTQTCTRGIVVTYDRGSYTYWNTLYLDYMNRSEMCNSTNIFFCDPEGTNTLAISPIYKEGWRALTYYKYTKPGMDEDLRDYIKPSDETIKILKEAHKIAEDAMRTYPNDVVSILRYVNDKICDLTTYSNPVPTDKESPARDVMGVFINHDAVCEGYTAAIQLVLNILGFENHTVKNKADTHIWNRVKVNGTWYHIDATWNDRKAADGSYKNEWFMLTDEEITKKNGNDTSHIWETPKYLN